MRLRLALAVLLASLMAPAALASTGLSAYTVTGQYTVGSSTHYTTCRLQVSETTSPRPYGDVDDIALHGEVHCSTSNVVISGGATLYEDSGSPGNRPVLATWPGSLAPAGTPDQSTNGSYVENIPDRAKFYEMQVTLDMSASRGTWSVGGSRCNGTTTSVLSCWIKRGLSDGHRYAD